MLDLDWKWKKRPAGNTIYQQQPALPPRRVPAPPVQTEYRIKPAIVAAHPQPPKLCPVFIPKEFHSLPEEGLIKAEILPYSSVPLDFRPINEDTSSQRPLTYSQLQQNAFLQAPASVNSLPSLQIPGGQLAGGMAQGDTMLSQPYIPLHAMPQQQEAAINMFPQHMLPQPAASFPMQMPAQVMQGQPSMQGSPIQSRPPTKDLNQALYSGGGNDRWT
jgi:hypothetical protein